MNVALSPDELARACADAMWKEDDASKGLGMKIVEIKPGQATLTMTVQPHMVNGQRIAHGGFIFLLADSTFAFACNSRNERAVAAQCDITFIRPGKLGDVLVATAREISRSGRSGIYDVRVTAGDVVIAEFRGHSRTIAGTWLPADGRRGQINNTRKRAMAATSMQSRATSYRPELDEAERASRDEIMALQTKRLAWSLKHAYDNVAHYRKAFDAAGVHPSDFKQLSDLAKFPFTVKTDLRDNYPFNMFAVPREKLVRVHASSGTTGKPIVVGYTQGDIDIWSDVMARSIRAAGGRTGMLMHNAYGYGLFTGGLGAHYGAERLGCTVVPVSGGMTERQVQLINDFKPDIITVTPSYMLAISDEFKRQGLDPRKSSLKFGIFGAEPWTNAMRAEIEQTFDMEATDIYGLSEVIGPGVAQECVETKDGLHIWEDHFYPEVIDPETGKVLPDGEKGELVFTSLTKEGFPIIRYRTRDLTRLLPGTARPGMRRMEKVTGRSDDMIILRGVNVFPTQIEEALLATDWCGGHFIIELTREGRMDEMTVLAEARPESWDGSGLLAHAEKVAVFIKNTDRHHRAHQGRGPGHAGTFARQGETCLRQAAERVTPAAHE